LKLKISIEEKKGVNIEKYVENNYIKIKNKWKKSPSPPSNALTARPLIFFG
jgi:hypothetical protein